MAQTISLLPLALVRLITPSFASRAGALVKLEVGLMGALRGCNKVIVLTPVATCDHHLFVYL